MPYSKIFFKSPPLIECSGNIKKFFYAFDPVRKQIHIKLYGRSRIEIKAVFTEVPGTVSGAEITSLYPTSDNKHAATLETNITAFKELTIA